jgi:DNA replication protein DnaC
VRDYDMQSRFYTEIKTEYENIRMNNTKILDAKIKKLYTMHPKLKEIDQQLSQIQIKLSKNILLHTQKNDCSINELQKKILSLQKKRNELLFDLHISKEYFYVYTCGLCKDTGYIDEKKCSCFIQKLINKYYDVSNIKHILSEENFKTFRFDYYSRKKIIDVHESCCEQIITDTNLESPYELIMKAFKASVKFIKEFDSTYSNLLFFGNTGLGKTFMCNCIAKEILDKGRSVFYLTAPQLLKAKEKNKFYNNCLLAYNDYDQIISQVELLIIDDLGAEFVTSFWNSELFDIINSRIIMKRPVIISTNLSLEDLEKQYTSRIFSRFIGSYIFIKFIGNDIRYMKLQNKKS